MTICDYHMVMKKTGIAELKAHLSQYLRVVRGGEEVTVLDRETPIATIVPSGRRSRVVVRRSSPGAPAPGRIKFLPPLDLGADPVAILLADRSRR
jgi:antitoxin (DNA-binding transcriptional repressor) of toxin-antitoxin stability system